MKAVDTNILARFILRDDEHQVRQAEAVLRSPVWVAGTVLVELGWVLYRKLRMDRAVVADALATLIALDTVYMSDRLGMLWAVERFRTGADWADAVHLVTSREAADGFITFDGELERHAGLTSPLPVETLR